jgi:hypothetical protein
MVVFPGSPAGVLSACAGLAWAPAAPMMRQRPALDEAFAARLHAPPPGSRKEASAMRAVMQFGAIVLAALAALAAAPHALAGGPTRAQLIAAAKAATLKDIDYLEDLCRNDRTVEAWLAELTAGEAARIDWTAGRCELVDPLNGLDGGGPYCAQARIVLAHPRARTDRPEVEIYLEDPRAGRPGSAYAFRGLIDDAGLLRFRADFEATWLERFPANAQKLRCAEYP